MVAMASLNLPDKGVRQQVASAINLVVHLARMSDGTRKVVCVSEITGMEGDMVSMQDIFLFEKLGVDPNGKVKGRFVATGIRPKSADRLAVSGVPLPARLFEHVQQVG